MCGICRFGMAGGMMIAALGLAVVVHGASTTQPKQPTTAPTSQPATTQAVVGTTTASGLTIIILAEGRGDRVAKAGDTVTVNYVGRLEDGKQFDASADHGGPFTFPLGESKVIAGWDEGVAGMKIGEKRKLIVPSKLAYGEQGAGGGVIPPNATLIFEVELVGIQSPQ